MFNRQPIRPTLNELAHLVGTLQSEMGGRLSVTIFVVPNDNPDAVELDRFKGVFVGEVVADVDRQQGPFASMRSRIQASVVPLSQSISGRSSTSMRPFVTRRPSRCPSLCVAETISPTCSGATSR